MLYHLAQNLFLSYAASGTSHSFVRSRLFRSIFSIDKHSFPWSGTHYTWWRKKYPSYCITLPWKYFISLPSITDLIVWMNFELRDHICSSPKHSRSQGETRGPWSTECFSISSNLVLWEAVSQTKTLLLAKIFRWCQKFYHQKTCWTGYATGPKCIWKKNVNKIAGGKSTHRF